MIFTIVTYVHRFNKITDPKLSFDKDSCVVFIRVCSFFPLCAHVPGLKLPLCFPFILERVYKSSEFIFICFVLLLLIIQITLSYKN